MRTLIVVMTLLISTQAFARRSSSRDGFNFGTGLRLLNVEDSRSNGEDKISESDSILSVRPFIGYAFLGLFNVGVKATIERTESSTKIQPLKSTESTTTSQVGLLQGSSAFARLLFGRVMFLEATVGVYRGSNVTNTSTRKITNGNVVGTDSSESGSGVGIGYSFGGGIEIPITEGFFFSSAFTARTIKMQNYPTEPISDKMTNSQSEIEFGIIHYLK